MARLSYYLAWVYQLDVMKVLGDLLSTQAILQVLDLSDAGFGVTQGINLLSKLTPACGSTVTVLTINGILKSFGPVCIATQLRGFSKLTELSLSYENLSDELLNALADSGSLKRMNVTARSRIKFTHPSSKSWEQLKMSRPDLEAHFFINECLGYSGVLFSILTPGIPLVALDFSWKDGFLFWKYMCRHIGNNFQNHLRDIKIKICSELENASHFLTIINRCSLLEEISITDVHDHISDLETGIGSVVRKILARRPSSRLRKVTLNGTDVNLKSTWTTLLVDWLVRFDLC